MNHNEKLRASLQQLSAAAQVEAQKVQQCVKAINQIGEAMAPYYHRLAPVNQKINNNKRV